MPERTMRACVVIPSFDNAGTIAAVVARARAVLEPVFVVDDGSTDGTGDRAREAGAEVLVHEVNRGKGAALETGLAAAVARGFSHVVTLDGDGQHHPEDAPALLRAAEGGVPTLVVGSRPWDGPNRSRAARFGRWFSNLWVRIDGGVTVEDSQSGFRVYPAAEVLALRLRARRYDWEMEVLVRAAWAGIAIANVPIGVYYPPASERVSHFDVLRDNVRFSRVFATLFFLWPFQRLLPGRRATPAGGDVGWSGQAQGAVLGWHLTYWVMRLLGRRAVYVMLHPISAWYALFARRGRAASDDYLGRVLGPASLPVRVHRVRAHFRAFATYLVDRFLMLQQGPDAFEFVGEEMELLREEWGKGRGVMLLTSHFGNAELAGIALSLGRDVPVKLVMFQNERADVRRFLGRFGERMPEVIGVTPGSMASLEILKALRRGAVVAMKGDRLVDGNHVSVPFLGADAAFPTGPFAIAAIARSPIMEVHCIKVGPTRYRIAVDGPTRIAFRPGEDRDAQMREWVAAYAARLEAWVRRFPYQWFNFYRFWAPPSPPGAATGAAPDPPPRALAGERGSEVEALSPTTPGPADPRRAS
ncbi:glycosyltransferase family 2 protein [Myxococcota bacterium]|nr:glycosyltransferase family 2 protein [Myxococcota bacterium]